MNRESQNADRKRAVGKRGIAFIICTVLLLTVAVGTTAAFIFVSSEADKVTIEPAAVSCRVISDGGDYCVKNTGDTESYIRAVVIVSWQDEDGNIYGKKQPLVDVDFSYMLNLDDWFIGDDGYFYCVNAVDAGDTTANLIESFETFPGGEPEGYSLNVSIIAGAVQSYPEKAVSDNWGVTVLADGTLGK